MISMPGGPSAYFDVDGTLILWSGRTSRSVEVDCRGVKTMFYVNEENLLYLHRLASRGHAIIVWSVGGADWATSVAKALNIEHLVFACLTKPTYYIDDIKDSSGWIGKHEFYEPKLEE